MKKIIKNEEVVRETPKEPLPVYWDDAYGHWGKKPEEHFVVNCDYNTNTYGLSKDVAGSVVRYAKFDQLSLPKWAAQRPNDYQGKFYCGDLVRVLQNNRE